MLNFINQEKTLQGMFLVPLEKEEGIFREAERVKIFQRPLAAGRSEEKLTHTVKGFLMLDSRMTAGGVGKEAAGGERRPVRKLAGSAMN